MEPTFLLTDGDTLWSLSNSKNNAAMVFNASPGLGSAENKILVCKSTDNGDSWTNLIGDKDLDLLDAQVSSNGNLYAVGTKGALDFWNAPGADETPTPTYQLAYSANDGMSWTEVALDAGAWRTQEDDYPQLGDDVKIVIDSNGWAHILITARESTNTYTNVVYFRPTSATAWAAGQILETETDQGGAIVSNWAPSYHGQSELIILSDDTLIAAIRISNTQIQARRSTNGGSSWDAATTVFDDSNYGGSAFRGNGSMYLLGDGADGVHLLPVMPFVGGTYAWAGLDESLSSDKGLTFAASVTIPGQDIDTGGGDSPFSGMKPTEWNDTLGWHHRIRAKSQNGDLYLMGNNSSGGNGDVYYLTKYSL